MSGKVHSEHIVATKVLMPVWGGGVSGKVHSEHIVATKVLMPVGRGLGVWECALTSQRLHDLITSARCPDLREVLR